MIPARVAEQVRRSGLAHCWVEFPGCRPERQGRYRHRLAAGRIDHPRRNHRSRREWGRWVEVADFGAWLVVHRGRGPRPYFPAAVHCVRGRRSQHHAVRRIPRRDMGQSVPGKRWDVLRKWLPWGAGAGRHFRLDGRMVGTVDSVSITDESWVLQAGGHNVTNIL